MASLTGKLPNVRRQFVAGKGCLLVGADWSQQELRWKRIIAADEVLGEALESGDVYTVDAKAMFGLPPHLKKCNCKGGTGCSKPLEHIKPKARHQAKTGHLAFQYGCGLAKFHQQMVEGDQTVKWETSKLIWQGMRKRYWRTVAYWFEERDRVMRDHYSETRLLRRRRIYPAPPDLSEIANFPVQGTARDHATLAMLDLRKQFVIFRGEAFLIKDFHDAFMFECKREIVEDVKEVVKQCMTKPVEVAGKLYTFPIDIDIGERESDV